MPIETARSLEPSHRRGNMIFLALCYAYGMDISHSLNNVLRDNGSTAHRAPTYSWYVIVLSLRNSSMPQFPLNRPHPLIFAPPCGRFVSSWTVMALM